MMALRTSLTALALLGLLLLAGCGSAKLSFSQKSADASRFAAPPVSLVALDGLPEPVAAQFTQALAAATARRGITLVQGSFAHGLKLSGRFSSLPQAAESQVSYDWSLVNPVSGAEFQRITGTDSALGPQPFPPGLMARIAEATAETLASRFQQMGFASRAAGMPPPPDAFTPAGPGAEKDIDYETLMGPGVAEAPAPEPVPAIAPAPAAPPPSTPAPAPAPAPKAKDAVAIRSIALPAIAGDKTGELRAALKKVLLGAGWPVVDAKRPDALVILGKVTIAAPQGTSQTVRLDWALERPDGGQAGKISQSNQVPAGSLDSGWGETAHYAAQAAAEGIAQLVQGLR